MEDKRAEGKIDIILARLKRRYANEMKTSLDHRNALELLIATMLAAQSQDVQVNKVTPALFKACPTVKDYAKLKPEQLYKYIMTLGLYKNKAKNIVNAAKVMHENFSDTVPDTMLGLTSLPGVGRKTANIVLSNAFDKIVGIAIDTHCITVTGRLFLYETKNPEKIEQMLMKFVPQKEWGNITHLFVALGRDVCMAKTKYCERCVLNDICPSSTVRR
jgi:endonuclease-3